MQRFNVLWSVQDAAREQRSGFKKNRKKKRRQRPYQWQGGPLVGGVDVLGLGHARQLVLIARQAAEENSAADAQDGGAPAEAVRPGVVVVALEDQLVELDRIDDQCDDLQHHCGVRGRVENSVKLWPAVRLYC